jgi:cytidylate kinase
MSSVPVITLDGPSGSGKGTVSTRLASKLGWHYLDSGAIYRALAHAANLAGVTEPQAAANIARELKLAFNPAPDGGAAVLLDGQEITDQIRTEECGALASKLAAEPSVREALLQRQRDFRSPPGLVADGRDMGTVVFPDAEYKIYLTASAEVRAQRRHKQLKDKGINDSIARLLEVIRERDARDEGRETSPLKPAADAIVLDTSDMSLEEVVACVEQKVGYRRLS